MEGAPTLVEPFSQITTYLLSFGLPGVGLLVLGWAYNKKDKRIDELNDAILEIAKEYAKATTETTSALNALRDLLVMRNKAD